MTATTRTARITVFCTYARHNGKPAGFVGQFRTEAEARDARPYGGVVKRETTSSDAFAVWERSGFLSRGWIQA